MQKETGVKGRRQKWDTTDTKIYKGMSPRAGKHQPEKDGTGVFTADRGGRGPSVQSQRRCSTHGVDDALQSLKAVIYWKYMILTVRNPGQLRTHTNTHGDVSRLDMEN